MSLSRYAKPRIGTYMTELKLILQFSARRMLSAMSPPEPTKYVMAQVVSPWTDESIQLQLARSIDFDIHPIFSRPRWIGVDDVTMLRIGPALVLASRLLTCPASLHFIHAFLFGPRNITFDKTSGKPCQRFHRIFTDPSQPLPRDEAAKVRQALIQLTDCFDIKFTPRLHKESSCAETVSRPDDLITQGRPGSRSHVRLPSKVLADLDFATPSRLPLYRRWLHLAVTVNHEAMHVLNNARHGAEEDERSFEGQTFCEMGWAWEHHVLGGAVSITHEKLASERVDIVNLPVNSTAKEENARMIEGGGMKEDLVGVLSDQKLEDLFTDNFWSPRPS